MSSDTTTTTPADLPAINAAVDTALIKLLTLNADTAKVAADRAQTELHQILTMLDDPAPPVVLEQAGPVIRTAHQQLRRDDIKGARASLVAARGWLSRPSSHRSDKDSTVSA